MQIHMVIDFFLNIIHARRSFGYRLDDIWLSGDKYSK